MLLRRVTEHIKTQNWTAVALDFAIVVVGVFIGIQVSNWNDARADRIAEKEYLSRLVIDSTASIELIDMRRDSLLEWARNVEALVAGLANGDRVAVAVHEDGLLQATRINRASPQFATITELISSGRINIIQDVKIRNAIAEAESEARNRDAYVDILNTGQKSLLPIIRTRFRLVTTGEDPDGFMDYRIEYDFDALAADDEFINALSQSANHLRVNAGWLNSVKTDMEKLRSLIIEANPSLAPATETE
ncbi:MAG: hypothetical protein HKP25_10005 [Marinicaulis sp.]|nr:hypothetical protein [Marinicaulis sp.]NNL89393.1 hypothetical protein [Marinicaulis sp.]